MNWATLSFLSLLAAVILCFCSGVDGATIGSSRLNRRPAGRQGTRIFMREPDASNFFRQRGQGFARQWGEIYGGQRQRGSANRRRSHYSEEQTEEFESYETESYDERYRKMKRRRNWFNVNYDEPYRYYYA